MKILLSSVFGPYGVDDAYGRKENVMELFHNQVTREQGVFSLRFFHQSFGLHFIAENLKAPTVVLDFPSQKRFISEIKKGYDYIGISFIVPNFVKAKQMALLIRQHAPKTKIILGGHGTRIDNLESLIAHDFICRGEGVRWMRQLLGEPVDAPLRHPVLEAGFGKQIVGVPMASDAAALIPGVGCPNGCRFCATSHFFNKQYTPFFDTGAQLFAVCEQIEKASGRNEFFVMDENFLKRPQRARELLQLMETHHKQYTFGIFSSAEAITQVGVPFLARLGVHFVWIGVESKREIYEKNKGIQIKPMIAELRDHGIGVLASGILFLEHHDRDSIWDDIRFITDLQSDFVQFMGLGPMPGTPLYQDYEQKGLLRHDVAYEDWHGQDQIWFNHPNFSRSESATLLRQAFRYDFDTQGASLLRLCETQIRGFARLSQYDDAWMKERGEQVKKVAMEYRPALQTMLHYAQNPTVRARCQAVIDSYERVLGPATWVQKLKTQAVKVMAWKEAMRVAAGRNVYQPKTHVTGYRMSLLNAAATQLSAAPAAQTANPNQLAAAQ